jgi:hypothetical protein
MKIAINYGNKYLSLYYETIIYRYTMKRLKFFMIEWTLYRTSMIGLQTIHTALFLECGEDERKFKRK